MAAGLGRSPSTVHDEVMRHRFVWAPKARRGEPAPGDLAETCPRLGAWPRCRDGCAKHGGYGCSRRPQVFYRASMAQRAADAELSEAREGVDETEAGFQGKVATIKDGLDRGLSPEQIVSTSPGLGVSKSTVYAWIDRGYAGMSNMDLRRKVSYKPRSRKVPRRDTSHSGRRSYDAFRGLGEDVRASAREMDTVVGTKDDTQCLLTLYHRPTSFKLSLPFRDQTSPSVLSGLGLVERALGSKDAMRRAFGVVLTDNGSEFADEGALASAFGERAGETGLYYCDPRRADQKGGCERNHTEIRKLLPKGRGIRFDRLTPRDCSLLMSEVNSEPRGKLAWMTPAQAFRHAFGDGARDVLEAFGIERVGIGELDMTPRAIEDARARRGEAPPQIARHHNRAGPPGAVRLSLDSSRTDGDTLVPRTHPNALPRASERQKRRHPAPSGRKGGVPLTAGTPPQANLFG